MTVQAILLPLFVEVILTFRAVVLAGAVARPRFQARASARPDNVALREPNWSPRTLQVAYAFSNQFELPVLFYVLTILAYVTHLAGFMFVVLAWIFVVFRYLQAYVHVTSNNIRAARRVLRRRRHRAGDHLGDLYRRSADAAAAV